MTVNKMREKTSIVNILWKYQQSEPLSAMEEEALGVWLKAGEQNQLLFDELSNSDKWNEELRTMRGKDSRNAWIRLETALQISGIRKSENTLSWQKFAAAAAIISAFVFGTYFLITGSKNAGGRKTVSLSADNVMPAVRHATLTLGSGKIIGLDTAGGGQLTSTNIWKTDSNSLTFLAGASGALQSGLNILATSPGTQYRLVLPDSSTVWLNAGSQLQFPSGFPGRERKVILAGEGYFEVTKNREKPFVIQSGNAIITVLGTHFNVRNYENDTSQRTTLLEGKVRIRAGNDSAVLTPGQQAFFSAQAGMHVSSGDLRQAVAWRKNLFWFQSASFEDIAHELERWYPVRVHQKDLITQRFTGILPRDRPLAEVLKILEMPGYVKFRLRGNDLEVTAQKPE